MSSPRPWLPANALEDGALSSALSQVMFSWLSRWVEADRRVSLQQTPVRTPTRLRSDATIWTSAGGDVRLHCDHHNQTKLALAMLAFELPPGRSLKPQDNAVLQELAATALDDLSDACARLLALAAPPTRVFSGGEATTGYRFRADLDGGGAVLDLYVGAATAIAARKELLRTPHPAPSLSPLAAALGAQSVGVGARLGASTMRLSELLSLEIGDVVVIDRGPSELLELTVNGQAKPRALCALSAGAESFCLEMRTAGVTP